MVYIFSLIAKKDHLVLASGAQCDQIATQAPSQYGLGCIVFDEQLLPHGIHFFQFLA